jgi:hypothetical protein
MPMPPTTRIWGIQALQKSRIEDAYSPSKAHEIATIEPFVQFVCEKLLSDKAELTELSILARDT